MSYLHSVVHEFDYIDPFAASLNAFRLRGELLFGTVVGSATELAVVVLVPMSLTAGVTLAPFSMTSDTPILQLANCTLAIMMILTHLGSCRSLDPPLRMTFAASSC